MSKMNKVEMLNHCAKGLIENGNYKIVEAFFSPEYIAHAENKKHSGHAFIKRYGKILRKSIPNIRMVNVDVLVEKDNRVTWQRTMSGTHKANMMGIPASNKKITWNEMVVTRFEDDKIAEEWVVSELMGQLLLNLKKN